MTHIGKESTFQFGRMAHLFGAIVEFGIKGNDPFIGFRKLDIDCRRSPFSFPRSSGEALWPRFAIFPIHSLYPSLDSRNQDRQVITFSIEIPCQHRCNDGGMPGLQTRVACERPSALNSIAVHDEQAVEWQHILKGVHFSDKYSCGTIV